MGRRIYRSETDLVGVRVLGVMLCQACQSECPKLHGHQRWCQQCALERKRAADRAYAARNAAKNRARVKEWRSANPECVRATRAKFKDKNPALVRAREAKKYRLNGERIRHRARQWYAENREAVLAEARTDDGRKRARDRMRSLMRDPAFRLSNGVSSHIRKSIIDKRRRPWEGLVGYTIDQLIMHIERQFLPGMSWDNYGRGSGKWHIDHIVPRASFAFRSAEDAEFKACWALTNLRPMWGEANIRKHANRLHLL